MNKNLKNIVWIRALLVLVLTGMAYSHVELLLNFGEDQITVFELSDPIDKDVEEGEELDKEVEKKINYDLLAFSADFLQQNKSTFSHFGFIEIYHSEFPTPPPQL